MRSRRPIAADIGEGLRSGALRGAVLERDYSQARAAGLRVAYHEPADRKRAGWYVIDADSAEPLAGPYGDNGEAWGALRTLAPARHR